jgi:hypothetical protein
MTREAFAKRYGFSAPSIKAIETGTYSLKADMAARISAATGVLAQSLLEDHDPLLSYDGKLFTINTKPEREAVSDHQISTACFLLRTALEEPTVVREKAMPSRAVQLRVRFQECLHQTILELGMEKQFQKRLLIALAKDGRSARRSRDRAMIYRHTPHDSDWQKRAQALEDAIQGEILEIMCALLESKGERFRELERKHAELNAEKSSLIQLERPTDERVRLRKQAIVRYAKLNEIPLHPGDGFARAQDEIRALACDQVVSSNARRNCKLRTKSCGRVKNDSRYSSVVYRIMRSSCSALKGTSSVGTKVPRTSRATRPRRLSVSIFPASILLRT